MSSNKLAINFNLGLLLMKARSHISLENQASSAKDLPTKQRAITPNPPRTNMNNIYDLKMTPDKVIENRKSSNPSVSNVEVQGKAFYSKYDDEGKAIHVSKSLIANTNSISNIAFGSKGDLAHLEINDSFRSNPVNTNRKTNRTRTGRLVTTKEIYQPTLRINIIAAKGKLTPENQASARSQLNGKAQNTPKRSSSHNIISKNELDRSLVSSLNHPNQPSPAIAQFGLAAWLQKPKYSEMIKSPAKNPDPIATEQIKNMIGNMPLNSIQNEKRELRKQMDEFEKQAREYMQNAQARLNLLEKASSLYQPGNISVKECGSNSEENSSLKMQSEKTAELANERAREEPKVRQSLYEKIMRTAK